MLSRDQRIKIHTLHNHSDKTYLEIAQNVECSLNQVRYAITHRLTPQKHRCGRHLLLSETEINDLIDFVYVSRQNRRMTWLELSAIWNCSEKAISNAFKSEGFSRRITRKKPSISETNRIKRLAWAKEHLDWTTEQWRTILWTDKTWVTGGRHTRTWVTRRKGEEFNSIYIINKI